MSDRKKYDPALDPREAFFKGIGEMIKEFSGNDLEKLKTIIYNEIFSRRTEKHKKGDRIIVQPGVIG